jgi:cellulose synthase operon protein C
VPRGYGGHFFAIVDAVDADAGTLPADYNQAALYGSVQAVGPGALAAFPGGSPQSAQGVDLGLGWESERLRADLGTTPLGFTVENWVGGLRWSDRAGSFDYGFNLSRRPIIGSLISYAGAVDPASGRSWGGVVASGLSARLGRQSGRLYTSASLGGYRLTGRNVLDNDHLALRLAGDWRLLERPDLRLDGGLAFTYWTYAENLGEYSFGHGGYYSPQQYLSLSPTLEVTGRGQRWSYRLRGSVAFSDTVIDPQAFYPNDPALQAQAQSSPLPAGFAAPVYGPGGGTGVGYALRGALEYQLTPRWYLGGTLDLDRSEFYTPNAYGAYLRYDFDGRPLRIPFPPRPPRPYASF